MKLRLFLATLVVSCTSRTPDDKSRLGISFQKNVEDSPLQLIDYHHRSKAYGVTSQKGNTDVIRSPKFLFSTLPTIEDEPSPLPLFSGGRPYSEDILLENDISYDVVPQRSTLPPLPRARPRAYSVKRKDVLQRLDSNRAIMSKRIYDDKWENPTKRKRGKTTFDMVSEWIATESEENEDTLQSRPPTRRKKGDEHNAVSKVSTIRKSEGTRKVIIKNDGSKLRKSSGRMGVERRNSVENEERKRERETRIRRVDNEAVPSPKVIRNPFETARKRIRKQGPVARSGGRLEVDNEVRFPSRARHYGSVSSEGQTETALQTEITELEERLRGLERAQEDSPEEPTTYEIQRLGERIERAEIEMLKIQNKEKVRRLKEKNKKKIEMGKRKKGRKSMETKENTELKGKNSFESWNPMKYYVKDGIVYERTNRGRASGVTNDGRAVPVINKDGFFIGPMKRVSSSSYLNELSWVPPVSKKYGKESQHSREQSAMMVEKEMQTFTRAAPLAPPVHNGDVLFTDLKLVPTGVYPPSLQPHPPSIRNSFDEDADLFIPSDMPTPSPLPLPPLLPPSDELVQFGAELPTDEQFNTIVNTTLPQLGEFSNDFEIPFKGNDFEDTTPLENTNEQLSNSIQEPAIALASKNTPIQAPPFPFSNCYMNKDGYMCCNRKLERLMRKSFKKLQGKDRFNECSVQTIANRIQRDCEKVFNTPFETVVGIDDFALRAHFAGDFTCKIEVNGRFIAAYATAVPGQFSPGDPRSIITPMGIDVKNDPTKSIDRSNKSISPQQSGNQQWSSLEGGNEWGNINSSSQLFDGAANNTSFDSGFTEISTDSNEMDFARSKGVPTLTNVQPISLG